MSTSTALPIEPALYRATLAKLNLRQIVLCDLNLTSENPVADTINLNISSAAQSEHDNGELHVDAEYKVTARSKDSSLFSIEVTFRVIFGAPDELPVGFIETYIANNLSLTVFPYVREIVASLTSRMGLPPLTMPYIINPFAQTAEPAAEKPKRQPRRRKAEV